MTDQTVGSDKATSIADSAVHSVIFDVVLKMVKGQILAAAPWLKIPIISNIFDFVMNQIADRFYEQLARFVDFKIIDAETGAQNNDYKAAVTNLQDQISRPLETFPNPEARNEQIEKAKQNLRDKLDALARI